MPMDYAAKSAALVNEWTSTEVHQELFNEHLGMLMFEELRGNSSGNAIVRKKPRVDEEAFDIIGRFTGDGRSELGVLAGNEERLTAYRNRCRISYLRHGFTVTIRDLDYGDHKNTLITNAKNEMKQFFRRKEEGSFFDGLCTVLDGQTWTDPQVLLKNEGTDNESGIYKKASAANIDLWFQANKESRMQIGAKGDTTFADITASLAAVGAGDEVNVNVFDQLKEKAFGDKIHRISPLNYHMGGKTSSFAGVLILGTKAYAQAKRDPSIQRVLVDATPRDKNNMYISGKSRFTYNNLMVCESYDVPVIAGAGADGIDVELGFMLGAQAMGYLDGTSMKPTKNNDDDHQVVTSLGAICSWKYRKLQLIEEGAVTGKDNGVITCMFPAT